jgi:hypothetical protein
MTKRTKTIAPTNHRSCGSRTKTSFAARPVGAPA